MDSRLIRARVFPKKPLLLKDFLLDDLGSCSSNGFKSFPRQQCCSSIRFLHEFDLKNKQTKKKGVSFNKPAFSAFRRVFSAMKRLPFPAGMKSPPENKKLKYSFLPRSFWGLKRSGFWRGKSAARKGIERWKSFDQLLREDPNASSRSHRWPAAVGRFAAAECLSGGGVTDGTATAGGNDIIEDKNGAEVVVTNDDVLLMESTTTTTTTTTSGGSVVSTNSPTNPKQKQWLSEDKEQFSPMSVLDYCPFDDEDEVNSSPFQQRLARMEGTKKKLMKKIHMFESLAKLEPINLATRFTTKPDSDKESSTIDEKSTSDIDEQHEDGNNKVETSDEGIETKAMELLHQIKEVTIPSYYNNLKLNPDNLLLDFFKERLLSHQNKGVLEEVQNWMQGRWPQEAALEWDQLEKNRQAYVRDMERGGEWKTLDQEIKELVSMLECEALDALLDEVLVDILVL